MKDENTFGATDALLIVMVSIWAINPFFVQAAEREMNVFTFMILMSLLSCSLFYAIVAIRERGLAFERKDLLFFAAASVFGITLQPIFYLAGLTYTSASNTIVLLTATPVCVALLNRFFLKESLAPRGFIGIGMTILGVLFILLGDLHFDLKARSFLGNMLILGGVLSWSLYTLFSSQLLKTYSPCKVTALTYLIGTVPILFISIPSLMRQDWGQITYRGWGGLLFAAILSNTAAYLLWNMGTQKIGGSRTSLYMNLKPVITMFVAYFILHQSIGVFQVLGAMVIIAGLQLARTAKISSSRTPALITPASAD